MSLSDRRKSLTALLALGTSAASVFLLHGCGFQPRAVPRLAFGSVALAGFDRGSPLAEEFRRQLAPQMRVLDAPDKAEVVLQALEDKRERSVVASTSAAQVRELRLRLAFKFRATTATGRELIPRAELLLTRDLNWSETQALAKEAEEAELFREMQADVVAQVLRRLAAVRL
jgi:LPS-assembly lipoprotein